MSSSVVRVVPFPSFSGFPEADFGCGEISELVVPSVVFLPVELSNVIGVKRDADGIDVDPVAVDRMVSLMLPKLRESLWADVRFQVISAMKLLAP